MSGFRVVKVAPRTPNHNLWNNRGVWTLTMSLTDGVTSKRYRVSLKTKDVSVARRRRDRILAALEGRCVSI